MTKNSIQFHIRKDKEKPHIEMGKENKYRVTKYNDDDESG
jgi:hypothetical protein